MLEKLIQHAPEIGRCIARRMYVGSAHQGHHVGGGDDTDLTLENKGMDAMQEQHERGVGDDFIRWYNAQYGTAFAYYDRGGQRLDLIYRDGSKEMLLEITASYYGPDHAKMLWQDVRKVPGAPNMVIIKEPDQQLINYINVGLVKKCQKTYPLNCILVFQIYPDLISAEELNALIDQIQIPVCHPFKEIYLAGAFSDGYRCWKLA